MIISHKHRFIFIKTKKTAGTSIEVFLSQHCGDEDTVTPIYPHVEPHVARNYRGIWNPLREIADNKGQKITSTIGQLLLRKRYYNHIPAQTLRNRLSTKVWDQYFKFCIERNPWDKTLSHYHMVNGRTDGDMTLDQYISNRQFCINYPLYTDSDGELIVDKVIKYETLMDELSEIFAALKIPFAGSLGVKAKSEHRQDTRPYQQVLTDDQRTKIAQAFAKEIEMHRYTY